MDETEKDAASNPDDSNAEEQADQSPSKGKIYLKGLILAADLPPVPDWARRPPRVVRQGEASLFAEIVDADDDGDGDEAE